MVGNTVRAKVTAAIDARMGLWKEFVAYITVEQLSHLLLNDSVFSYCCVLFGMHKTKVSIETRVVLYWEKLTNRANFHIFVWLRGCSRQKFQNFKDTCWDVQKLALLVAVGAFKLSGHMFTLSICLDALCAEDLVATNRTLKGHFVWGDNWVAYSAKEVFLETRDRCRW